ncbi:MAG: DUF503 domain-containing protein [Acidaminococcales bacterium]|jgi:uncharacterized protein YlxP (DUF503 family)|nr:DUF503 domain-containing protein [Acidaminococcales bacterium]
MKAIFVLAAAELFLPAANSLKDKRQIVKSIVEKIKARTHASAAETDFHDLWRRAAVGMAWAGSDRRVLEKQEELAKNIINDRFDVEVVSFSVKYLAGEEDFWKFQR